MPLQSLYEPIPVYLDQNVYSLLREGEGAREDLLRILGLMSEKGALFVYSMIHVDECRASERPEAFVDVIEAISAYFLEPSAAHDTIVTLSPNRAREFILAETDITHAAARRMEDLLKPMQFAVGWLGGLEANALRKELLDGIQSFWSVLKKELPHEALAVLEQGKAEILSSLKDMPFQQLRDETSESNKRFRKHLPESYAQLDAVPDGEVVEYLVSRLDSYEQSEIRRNYPPKFWSRIETRKEGDLAGFAFMLFMMGLVRDSKVKKGNRARREKRFGAQFRDCQHLETATLSAVFVTFDKGAVRLAKAIYSYAGVSTQVVHLQRKST